MTFNADLYDVGKYQLKWLRVLGYIERMQVRVLCMLIVCGFIVYYFNNNMLSHDE